MRKVNLLNEWSLLSHMNLPVSEDRKGRVGKKSQLSKQVINYILYAPIILDHY